MADYFVRWYDVTLRTWGGRGLKVTTGGRNFIFRCSVLSQQIRCFMMKQNRIMVRHVEKRINSCLEHMEIISITGVYGSGKTTLAKKIAKERGMKFVSLDDPTICEQACQDPEGFIAALVPTGGVIDEFQKVPQLASVLKWHVKSDPRPGRFVITGSISMFGYLPARLPRTARVGLAPFSQAEIKGLDSPGGFLKDALKGELSPSSPHISLADLWPRILRGGYPGAQANSFLFRIKFLIM